VACVAFGLPGAWLLAKGVAGLIGPVALGIGISLGLAAASIGWAAYTLDSGAGTGLTEAAVWIGNWCWLPGYVAIPTLLVLLLPDGALPSERWRPVGWTSVGAMAGIAVGMAVSPYPLEDMPTAFAGSTNPLELETFGSVLQAVGIALLLFSVALSLLALALRFKRLKGRERDQLKWVLLGGALTVLLLASAFAAGRSGDLVFAAAMLPLPLSVAVAVSRHQMWDVNLIISRSLVYGALTVAVVAGYVAVLAAVSGLLTEPLAEITAVAVVAIGLQPLHRRLQTAANRLVYGDRDDPAAALQHLGERLVAAGEGTDVLPTVADTVSRALRLPYVAVSVDGTSRAVHGRPAGEILRVELLYRGERVGELAAAPREPGRGFTGADRRALETIGRQVAVAAHAVRLTEDLRSSRERLLLAREEERRRLRRDLHDQLGPTLAGLALKLESAGDLPEPPEQTLRSASAQARAAVADVRRLVHDLRPAPLDDLGLAGALRERAVQLSGGGPRIEVDSAELPDLPAAVELAAYQIASEAMANAARHSGAGECLAEIEIVAGTLTVTVRDDGRGLTHEGEGVGLSSMRERAEELGGSLMLRSPDEGGMEVHASLPLRGS
jgi:signal transduction histidine kinase